MLKKTLISAALLGAAMVAAPASAQYYGNNGYHRGNDVRQQIYQLENRIERAAYNRTISRREAYRLQQQVDLLQRLERRYSYNGLSRWERQDLQRRVYGIRQQLRYERRDGDDRRWDRDGRYDRWDN